MKLTVKSPRTVGRYLAIDPPGSNVTSRPRACSASSGPRPWSGCTRALPPPCGRPWRAYGPINATRRTSPASGSTPSSFFSSTIARAVARRMTDLVSGSSAVVSAVGVSAAPAHSASASTRATDRSRSSTPTSPRSTAARRCSPRSRGGPGISTSRPASNDAAALCVPNQSLTTSPSKPHSPRSSSVSSHVVLAAERAVEAVVPGHDDADVGVANGSLERHEVQLAERAFVDLRRDRHPLELGVVADEVLDARRHPLALQPAHVGDRQLGGQDRVLAEALEVASADRCAVEVHGRGEHDVGALRVRLPPERPAHLLDQRRIPRRAERRAARERGRRRARPRRATDARRAVGHADRRDRRSVEGGGVPCVGPGQQGDLLVDAELGEKFLVEACRHGRMVATVAATWGFERV